MHRGDGASFRDNARAPMASAWPSATATQDQSIPDASLAGDSIHSLADLSLLALASMVPLSVASKQRTVSEWEGNKRASRVDVL